MSFISRLSWAMVRAMRALRFACATTLLGLGVGCAPVQSKTHFERWDEYAAKTASETETTPAEEATGPSSSATPASSTTPPPPPPARDPLASDPVYGSGASAPATTTSTKSRVVRPGDTPAIGDEDVIY